MAWQESDLSLFSPPSAPVLDLIRAGVTFPRSATSTTPTSNDSRISPTSQRSSGISTGQAAGIGAGATIAGITIIGTITWLLWRRRRAARMKLNKPDSRTGVDNSQSFSASQRPTAVAEMPHGTWRSEANGVKSPRELETRWAPVEADSGTHGGAM